MAEKKNLPWVSVDHATGEPYATSGSMIVGTPYFIRSMAKRGEGPFAICGNNFTIVIEEIGDDENRYRRYHVTNKGGFMYSSDPGQSVDGFKEACEKLAVVSVFFDVPLKDGKEPEHGKLERVKLEYEPIKVEEQKPYIVVARDNSGEWCIFCDGRSRSLTSPL